MSDWIYSDVVKDHFMNPKNVLMEDEKEWPCDGRGIVGNLKCGDQMLILISAFLPFNSGTVRSCCSISVR